jgi:hypothetical protein
MQIKNHTLLTTKHYVPQDEKAVKVIKEILITGFIDDVPIFTDKNFENEFKCNFEFPVANSTRGITQSFLYDDYINSDGLLTNQPLHKLTIDDICSLGEPQSCSTYNNDL